MKESSRPAELLTIAEAARILACCPRTIRRAVKSRALIAIQAPGTEGRSGLRILARSVSEYLEREVGAAQ